ncbi:MULTISPECIES: SDR family NAD(P)-dependent oxidoreductase [Pseudomonas]|jgi:NAD(P)-dependent dehydrogenase (short-subunit alcohol dehydrogenase family)|uniref:3-oxoacyl-(Acyl-carrier-protein) reductase n=1 Tax=Pseudomonas fulva (strain 12-X) TaxID=743720 RepID=F6ADQ5_PSEF1|nr:MULTISPECIES: SDR family oxidoreductase [Pseudomonas]AEF21245.1 3-oxoacyl-(acyl-carrier-protein) reductase [Pseudomonas fulva 12-X]MBD9397412.1 SDR family oxidoreductase [Pseudomonas sp. PDM11]MBV7563790.1 SDR family oxidoreductase [Pseudomonas sp. sia0905]
MTDINNPVVAEVAGKVALVTGAASGIGNAIVTLLHERGAKVVAEDIDPRVEQLAAPGLVPLVADITEDGAAERAVALAVERFGRLDILVNNAGIIINKPVVDMSRTDWERIQAVNATAAFLHCREAMKAMMPSKSGAIVNIASYASYFAFPTIGAYAASKGALAQLTRTLALEAIEHGIRVNAVGSGDVVTNILNDVVEDGPAFLAQHGEGAPIGRAAQPEEIAEVVAFLASERASFMVGAVVMADGGMTVTAG